MRRSATMHVLCKRNGIFIFFATSHGKRSFSVQIKKSRYRTHIIILTGSGKREQMLLLSNSQVYRVKSHINIALSSGIAKILAWIPFPRGCHYIYYTVLSIIVFKTPNENLEHACIQLQLQIEYRHTSTHNNLWLYHNKSTSVATRRDII